MAGFEDPELYRTILDSMQTGVYLVDKTAKILLWNNGAERITGHLRQDMLGRHLSEDLLSQADTENNILSGENTPIATTLREGKPQETEISLQHKSGHRVPVKLRTVPVRNTHGEVIGVAECFDETITIADWDRRHNKLASYGGLDQETGVMNHGLVFAHLRESIFLFHEQNVPFSVLCVGINELDMHRQRHGPGALALILRGVGQTLEHSLRPTDFLGRWNDSEFLAVLRECGPDEIGKVGDRLLKMVNAARVEWWGDMLKVTVSMGITAACSGDSAELMVERAEIGLRESLNDGKSQIVMK